MRNPINFRTRRLLISSKNSAPMQRPSSIKDQIPTKWTLIKSVVDFSTRKITDFINDPRYVSPFKLLKFIFTNSIFI